MLASICYVEVPLYKNVSPVTVFHRRRKISSDECLFSVPQVGYPARRTKVIHNRIDPVVLVRDLVDNLERIPAVPIIAVELQNVRVSGHSWEWHAADRGEVRALPGCYSS